MKARTFLRLSQYREFWRIRAEAKKLHFGIAGRLFRVRYLGKQERANSQILLSFLQLTTPQILFSAVIAAVLQILELMLVPHLVNQWELPDAVGYIGWLGTIAQIGGVFIALYFTAVTAAAGSIYAQVPNNIRDLLARERVGNIYIRYLTTATFLPLCLIAMTLAGFEPIRIAVPFVDLMAGVGIIAFAALGRRAFDLFDPTRLAHSLFFDLDGWLSQVSAGGFRWKDRSFQNHAHSRAANILDTLQTLADLAGAHTNLNGKPLLEFTTSIVAVLTTYQNRKLRIPTNSLWFEQGYKHKSWYETADHVIEIAHNAGVRLEPASLSDYDWLEKRLEPIATRCFELNVVHKRIDNMGDLIAATDNYLTALATNGNIASASSLALAMRDIYRSHANDSLTEECTELPEQIGVADALSMLQLRPLLAYRSSLEHRTPDLMAKRLIRINWASSASLYENGFGTKELQQLEWLFPRIELELNVEEMVRTPLWYQQDLLTRALAEDLRENVDSLIYKGSSFFQTWSDELIKEGRFWQSAAVISRYIEYMNKLAHHISFFASYSDLLKTSRHLTDLPWPEIQPDLWIESIQKMRCQLVTTIASHVAYLSTSRKPEGIPDYLGQFLHESTENLFESLIKRNNQQAEILMKTLLVGAFALFEKLKPTQPKPDPWSEQQLQIAAAPVLDVLELSGYGKLFAELYDDNQLWDAVAEPCELHPSG